MRRAKLPAGGLAAMALARMPSHRRGDEGGDDIIPPPIYKGGIMCPGWGGDNHNKQGGGDTSVDPTRAVGPYGGAASVRPRDETKRGLDDPDRIEMRSRR